MPETYKIVSSEPTIYRDENGDVINGVLVRVRLVQWNELQEIRVPRLDANLVKTEIAALVEQRTALDDE